MEPPGAHPPYHPVRRSPTKVLPLPDVRSPTRMRSFPGARMVTCVRLRDGRGMMPQDDSAAVSARVVLPGHADTVARVDVDAVPMRARVLRTLMVAGAWGAIS